MPMLEPVQSDAIPTPSVYYTLVMPPMLYETREPGPKEQKTSHAWAVANEFTFRTGLRRVFILPAMAVTPGDNGYLFRFQRKDGKPDVPVFVRSDFRTAEWLE